MPGLSERWWRCACPLVGEGDLTLGVMEGVAEASGESGCVVVGGDLSAGGVLTVVVTVMGTLDGGAAVERAGGQPGDAVFVSGPCGGSAAGLRVLRAMGRADRWHRRWRGRIAGPWPGSPKGRWPGCPGRTR